MTRQILVVTMLLGGVALAAPRYGWSGAEGEPLAQRFPAPPGFARVPGSSYAEWLRGLPMQAPGAPVLLFDGRAKPRQDVHAGVVAIDVGKRDLQQCADAVMRLRAEYLWSRGEPIAFHPDPGKPTTLRFDGRDRARFEKYLSKLFSDAGSASLQAEMAKVRGPVEPGDVLIQGGYPGHAVAVLDVVMDASGRRKLLLAQSYMPAQSIHVLRVDPARPERGAWYDEAALDSVVGLQTPEWRPFKRGDVRRFK